MNRIGILQAAKEKLIGERDLKYWIPECSFDKVAQF